MYHYAVNNMLKYSKDINKIYDDCLSGRGDKDVYSIARYREVDLNEE